MSDLERVLAPRERVYLMDAARGFTAKQTAHRNGVTVNTVNTSLKRAKQALGASNITHAVVCALFVNEFGLKDL
jgi:DNA-binding CsgD family transcriptional regulator